MQYIYDLVPLAIIIILAATYYKKGLISIILSAVIWVVSLILGWFFSSWFVSGNQQAVNVGNTTVPITRSVLFFVIFFVVSIVLQLICRSLQKMIDKIPLVGTANHFMGMIIGLVLGLVFTYVLINLVAVIIYASNDSLSWMNNALIEKTLLFKYMYWYNLLRYSPFG